MKDPLSVDQLRRIIKPEHIKDISEEKAAPLDIIVGQDRAVKALKTGLGIKSKGFNVFVAGQPGTGRLSAVDKFLEEFSKKMEAPDDWVYINNFKDPYRPCAIKFPTGKALEFKEDMISLIDEVRESLNKAFDSDEYAGQKDEVLKEWDQTQDDIFSDLTKKAIKEGFELQGTPGGTIAIPLSDEGKPMTDKDFNKLSQKEKNQLVDKQNQINDGIQSAIREIRDREKEVNKKIDQLKHDTALNAIGVIIQELKEKYEKQDMKRVVKYLENVEADVLDNVNYFIQGSEKQNHLQMLLQGASDFDAPLVKYEVNILVDNSKKGHAPVVIERNPTYNNLFGKIEKESKFGTLVTDFTLIRDGAFHRANGGYLVIPVRELLSNPFVYDSLKRTLVANEIKIEEIGERYGFLSGKSIDPQPIPLNCKVILVGEPLLYRLLYEYDKEFRELFKIVADFDTEMDYSDENIEHFVNLIYKLTKNEDLFDIDHTGMVKVVEHAIRLAEDQEKISTKFGEIADILREADFHAKQNGHDQITGMDIKKAIEQKEYRSSLFKEKIRENIKRGTIFIDVKDKKTGQVNGLSIIDLGDQSFGRPTRITANVSLGQQGIIDIEREVELGGPIHSKGVLILNGYLAETFGQEFPISLSASIVFEQSYGEIEGDSASSTELYALLSSLADVPIAQGIAVTGSVNQKGEVQPVGGINEKIEGFYEVCREKGLTGEQGVIIPAANCKHLMLKEEVLEAVSDGQFKLWAVNHIDEGIEILTGMKAGQKLNGFFEKDSIKARVYERLENMANRMREFNVEKGEVSH